MRKMVKKWFSRFKEFKSDLFTDLVVLFDLEKIVVKHVAKVTVRYFEKKIGKKLNITMKNEFYNDKKTVMGTFATSNQEISLYLPAIEHFYLYDLHYLPHSTKKLFHYILYVLAHEYGHMLDYQSDPEGYVERGKISNCAEVVEYMIFVQKFFKYNLDDYETDDIFWKNVNNAVSIQADFEKTADDYARKILNEIGSNDMEEFYNEFCFKDIYTLLAERRTSRKLKDIFLKLFPDSENRISEIFDNRLVSHVA